MRRALSLFALSLALTGCAKPPSCTDPEVLSLLQGLVQDDIREAGGPPATHAFTVAVDLAATNNYDSAAKKWSCEARVSLVPGAGTLDLLNAHVDRLYKSAHPSAATEFLRELASSLGQEVRPTPTDQELTLLLAMRSWKKVGASDLQTTIQFSSRFEEGGANRLIVGASRLGMAHFEFTSKLAKAANEGELRRIEAAIVKERSAASIAGPENGRPVQVHVQSAEMCGEEAVCLTTNLGEFRGNLHSIAPQLLEPSQGLPRPNTDACLQGATLQAGRGAFESAGPCK